MTIREFQRFAKQVRGSLHEYNQRYSQDPDGPMIGVSWFDSVAYCNWLSERDGLPRCYEKNEKGEYGEGMRVNAEAVAKGGYRLPTQAEREYACRARTVTSRYYGHTLELLGSYERYFGNSGFRALACGGLIPNDFGLFDLLGNVFEWCHDRHSDPERGIEAASTLSDVISSEVVSQEFRNLRGGSYRTDTDALRSASRGWFEPRGSKSDIGFRPVRTCP